jgi:hypothetical protein
MIKPRAITSMAAILLLSCEEHTVAGASGRVSNIRALYGNTECYYTLEVEKGEGLYSEDVTISIVKDLCGKYQIGDSITIKTEKCRLTDGATDTAKPLIHGSPTAVQ